MWCSTRSTATFLFVPDAADQLTEIPDLAVVEAACRLVKQQQLRPGSERPRKFDPFLRAEGQISDATIRHVVQFEVIDEFSSGPLE